MLELLQTVSTDLQRRGVPFALIGAGALAVYGVLRASDDLDLLVTDRTLLRPDAWDDLRATGASVQCKAGDDDDPLAGVVRISRPNVMPVDLVVGRHPAWQREVIARATPRNIGVVTVPVVTAADLILLTLYAGGAQDLADVATVLESGDELSLVAAVESELVRLPDEARVAWNQVRGR